MRGWRPAETHCGGQSLGHSMHGYAIAGHWQVAETSETATGAYEYYRCRPGASQESEGASRVEAQFYQGHGCGTGPRSKPEQAYSTNPQRYERHRQGPGTHQGTENLQRLTLGQTNVTDKGLVYLKELKNLQ